MLIVKIDAKNQYIDLSDQLVHENTVLITKTSGSVALIEQAINIEVHSKGLVAPRKKGRKEGESGESVAGAYVADPRVGMHQWIGSVDIRSEEHTSELQSLMRNSYAVFCLKKKKQQYKQR